METTVKRPSFSPTHREALQALDRQVEYDIAIRLKTFSKRDINRLVRGEILIEPDILGHQSLVTGIGLSSTDVLIHCGDLTYSISEISLQNKIDLLEAIERVL